MTPRRKPVQREKVEQAHIVQLLATLGAKVYVLGTHRRQTDFHGTMQTPGLQDLQAFLPRKVAGAPVCAKCRHVMNGQGDMCTPPECRCVCEAVPLRELVFVECKAAGGRLRPEQRELRELCLLAGVAHVVGGLDAVIAWLLGRGYLKQSQVPHYRLPAADVPSTPVVR